MAADYQVVIFGKAGCEKCTVLNKRVDALLAKDEFKAFEKVYKSLDTEEGLVAFAKAECVNPQRVPAFLIQARNPNTDVYEPVVNLDPDSRDSVCKNSRLYTHVGLQTDYTSEGKGLITPKMITSVLREVVA